MNWAAAASVEARPAVARLAIAARANSDARLDMDISCGCLVVQTCIGLTAASTVRSSGGGGWAIAFSVTAITDGFGRFARVDVGTSASRIAANSAGTIGAADVGTHGPEKTSRGVRGPATNHFSMAAGVAWSRSVAAAASRRSGAPSCALPSRRRAASVDGVDLLQPSAPRPCAKSAATCRSSFRIHFRRSIRA